MEGNIFDYLAWRGDLSFRQSTVNVVDALIFSVLTYINYPLRENEEITLKEGYARLLDLPEAERFRGLEMMRTQTVQLAETLPSASRYHEVRLADYQEISDEVTEKQFSAMSFLLPGKTLMIAYRGTDNTLVGWKEDFNMAFMSGTPAQHEATRYAESVAARYPDYDLQLTGHSKGGNLAVWAAVHLSDDLRSRIKRVYNNDGPGFSDGLTETDAYRDLSGRILSFVPESSIVGVLMGGCDYLTIRSTGISLMQHHPFTWKVLGKGFVYDTERSVSGKFIEKHINEMIQAMPPEEICDFVNDIYQNLKSDDEKTLKDLRKHLLKNVVGTLFRFGRFHSGQYAKGQRELENAVDQM